MIKRVCAAKCTYPFHAGELLGYTEQVLKKRVQKKIPLPDHRVEWIDFGMMGSLSNQQRQILLDLVTSVLMHDAYGLKKAVLQIAKPRGEINHDAMLQMCEGMCGQFGGSDFGDFKLGDLLGTVLGGLQSENNKVDPFITNLARGVIAIEGTLKTIDPDVNILNFFMDKVSTGMDLKVDLEDPESMKPVIAMKLMKLADGLTESAAKSA